MADQINPTIVHLKDLKTIWVSGQTYELIYLSKSNGLELVGVKLYREENKTVFIPYMYVAYVEGVEHGS